MSRWHSYVLDQIVLKPGTASKAGEWLLPEWRNGQRRPLEPEQLEDEAHDLTALATALASINKALAKLGDGAVAPVLVYLDLYLKTLFQTATTVPLLVKLLNAGLAASGVRLRVTPQTLWKRLRDYRRQHKITVHQLQLRVRIMIEGPGCLTAPGVRAYTFDSEPLDLPTGAHTFAPRCPALPPLPSRTE
ncbi:MAG: hypothetical protein LAO03_12420 [Acidobacteriia bacterium]|nr:hypothetical protein [Terriglobia bacterium]